ncbi:ComEC/Rec2 family competence protein [Paramuribaculum intestinale]|uniref:ComEC/Rec2 family competence protein n=1 Tax=Paramuribaculum intestinale TaxID=2094151 RepID=UPI003F6903BC
MMRLIKLRMSITGIIYRSGMKGDTKAAGQHTDHRRHLGYEPVDTKEFFGRGHGSRTCAQRTSRRIIASLLMIALYPLRLCRMRSAASASAIILLWSYAAVTGLSASVTRATVMASVLLMASMLQRRHSPANALCLAAMAYHWPSIPRHYSTISFQLSFAAVAGILLFARLLKSDPHHADIAHRLAGIVIRITLRHACHRGNIGILFPHLSDLFSSGQRGCGSAAAAPDIGRSNRHTPSRSCGGDPVMLNSVVDRLAQCVTGIANLCNNLPGATLDGLYFSPWLLVGGSLGYSASRLWAALPAQWPDWTASALCAGCHNKHGDDSGYARMLRSIYHSCRPDTLVWP